MIKATEKKKRGQPSKINKINKQQLKKLVQKGFTDKEVSEFFEITEQTFNNWKKQNTEFFESLKDWKLQADDKVERSLYERACGYSHPAEEIFCAFGKITRVQTVKHYPPSEVAAIFWLKNRQPEKWREKNFNVNVNGQSDDPEFIRQFFGFHKNGNGHGGNGNGNGKHN